MYDPTGDTEVTDGIMVVKTAFLMYIKGALVKILQAIRTRVYVFKHSSSIVTGSTQLRGRRMEAN